MELWELKQKQSLPLEAKIAMTLRRIREWYEYWDGNVYFYYRAIFILFVLCTER